LNDDPLLDRIFRLAQTKTKFLPQEVPDSLLEEVWDLAKMGPTSANNQPLRIVFVRSPEAKALLEPALSSGNHAKTMAAPVCAIFAFDRHFYELLPRLWPHSDARSWFTGDQIKADAAGAMNATLQAGYFMLAARAKGLGCGPMAGFDKGRVDAAFFPDGRWSTIFLCNLGFGDPAEQRQRNPRLTFAEACQIR
jgi:3-hydroxypropanoate dehydrogenase